jgi:hypothetical protein
VAAGDGESTGGMLSFFPVLVLGRALPFDECIDAFVLRGVQCVRLCLVCCVCYPMPRVPKNEERFSQRYHGSHR